jgi:hypothetical protein
MLPSSAIRVIENGSSRLVILDPPYYSFAAQMLLMSALATLAFLALTRTEIYKEMRYKWWVPMIISGFIVLAMAMLASRAYITLSRESGRMTIRRWICGIPQARIEFPLDTIRYATVENFSGARVVTVVLKSGEAVQLGNFTDQGGQFGAVDAINDFLGSRPTR